MRSSPKLYKKYTSKPEKLKNVSNRIFSGEKLLIDKQALSTVMRINKKTKFVLDPVSEMSEEQKSKATTTLYRTKSENSTKGFNSLPRIKKVVDLSSHQNRNNYVEDSNLVETGDNMAPVSNLAPIEKIVEK